MSPVAVVIAVTLFVVCAAVTVALFAGAKDADRRAEEMLRKRDRP